MGYYYVEVQLIILRTNKFFIGEQCFMYIYTVR